MKGNSSLLLYLCLRPDCANWLRRICWPQLRRHVEIFSGVVLFFWWNINSEVNYKKIHQTPPTLNICISAPSLNVECHKKLWAQGNRWNWLVKNTNITYLCKDNRLISDELWENAEAFLVHYSESFCFLV